MGPPSLATKPPVQCSVSFSDAYMCPHDCNPCTSAPGARYTNNMQFHHSSNNALPHCQSMQTEGVHSLIRGRVRANHLMGHCLWEVQHWNPHYFAPQYSAYTKAAHPKAPEQKSLHLSAQQQQLNSTLY